MTEKKQPEALRRASLLKLSGVLPGSVAMEVADDAIRLHAELETLRAGYAAARLEIESLRARSVEPAGEYPVLPSHGHASDGASGAVGYSADQMRAHGEACWKAGYKHGAWADTKPAAPDVSGYVSEWAGGLCTSEEAMDGIAKLYAAQPAGAQQPGTAYAALPYKQALGSTNCMQCCVSYMMGLPLENVPDFATDGGWERFSDFAETQGYVAVMLPGNREYEADYLASGTTARGTSHMVVMNDGKLVHDPHPSNAGLVDVQCVWLLAKRASPTQGQQDEHTAFEASAKTYTSNVSFERDASDYVDMTASLLWHGWKLRASHGQAPAQAAPAAVAGQSLQHLHDLLYTAQRTTGDAQAQAIAEARIALSDLMAAPQPVLATRAWPKVSGVSRDEGHPRALLVFFAAEPTDDEMRAVHDTLAAAPTAQPAPQQEAQEPVGYLYCGGSYGDELADWEIVADQFKCDRLNEHHGALGKEAKLPLYTAPQPSPASQGDALDAARYRWLRRPHLAAGHGSISVVLDDRANGHMSRTIWLDRLDAVIDAASAAHEGSSHG